LIRSRWAPPLIWSIIILSLTSIPNPHVPMPTGGDKWAHFLVYGILGVLVARAAELNPRRAAALAIIILGVSLFGALDEAHQAFIPGRFPDVRDWIADTIGGAQYSGIGGHEDFVSVPALSLEARSLLCLAATITVAGELRSRIVPWFPAGTVITTPRHQVDVIVTEYGAAELQGLTVHQRGQALAAIAHPQFRDELLEAANRASGGRSALP
jgi:hypothetical protein